MYLELKYLLIYYFVLGLQRTETLYYVLAIPGPTDVSLLSLGSIKYLLGGAQPVIPQNLYIMLMNIIAWGPQVNQVYEGKPRGRSATYERKTTKTRTEL